MEKENSEQKEQKKIPKKEKLKLVREILLSYPIRSRYGYLKKAQEAIFKKHKIKISVSYINKLIKEVEEQWAEEETRKITKKRIIEMYLDLYERVGIMGSDIIREKRRILTEIGKIEGHYIENMKVEVNEPLSEEKIELLLQKLKEEK